MAFLKGVTDKPMLKKEDDQFRLQPYIEGLGDYILECETPMTIAIQGDWGCGKTSMMNMVKDYLDPEDENKKLFAKRNIKVKTVWFNTWQFSQFNMGSQLSITFLQHLVKKLKETTGLPVRGADAGEVITDVLKSLLVGVASKYGGDAIGEIAEDRIKAPKDFAEQIEELQDNFYKLVQSACKDGNGRVVVFIDDLDRLQPVHAVELLEVLKIFVDCENCVFVIAIDTSVVFQGIREKYGHDISDSKAQSFFDKIIQLPFKMPVANYDLEGTITESLGLQNMQMRAEDKGEYVRLVKMASAGNPRSIKRIANFYLLTDKVAGSKGLYNDLSEEMQVLYKKILLAFSCIQLNYDKLYNFFVKDLSISSVEKITEMKLPSQVDQAKGYEMLNEALGKIGAPKMELPSDETYNFTVVVMIFLRACKTLLTKQLDGSAMRMNRKRLMSILSLTQMGDAVSTTGEEEKQLAVIARQEESSQNTAEVMAGVLESDEKDMTPSNYLAESRAWQAYCYLAERGVYPKASSSFEIDGVDPELKEYRQKLMNKEEELPLLNRICGELAKVYKVERTSYSVKIRLGSQDVFVTDSSGYYVGVKCPSKIFNNSGDCFDTFVKMVEEIKESYEKLQKRYGKIIFRDADMLNNLKEVYEQNTLIRFSDKGGTDAEIYIASNEMADIFCEYALILANKINGQIEKKNLETKRETEEKVKDMFGFLFEQ